MYYFYWRFLLSVMYDSAEKDLGYKILEILETMKEEVEMQLLEANDKKYHKQLLKMKVFYEEFRERICEDMYIGKNEKRYG